MQNPINPNRVYMGEKVVLKDGTTVTVMDNLKGIIRKVEAKMVTGEETETGTQYVDEWDHLEDGTPIELSSGQKNLIKKVRAFL